MKRLLLTGAAGGMGTRLRRALAGKYPTLRVSDIADLGPAGEGEEVVQCDLRDYAAVEELVRDCDGIVHLGGISLEDTFDRILEANFRGTYNVYEAARKTGKPRILFGSSNHATGFYPRETSIDPSMPIRPDSIYGVSKCFGEALSRYYFDQFGMESVCVRIGFCFPEPVDRRSMALWLSLNDMVRLIDRVFAAPRVAHTIVYGVSDNLEKWQDNSHARFLGWQPQDSSEQFREKIEAACGPDANDDAAVRLQGGKWTVAGHFED